MTDGSDDDNDNDDDYYCTRGGGRTLPPQGLSSRRRQARGVAPMMWSDKHRPATVSQMVGNEEARSAIVKWLSGWRPRTKPVLMVGPPGIGKTTMAFALAGQFGYDMIGLNASDARSKSKLNEVLGPAMGNAGVTGKPVMMFIDEVDGIHGRSDYGGASALADILKQATVPVLLAANDDSADKLKPVIKAATVVRFKRVPPRLLRAYLEHVLRAESTGKSGGTTTTKMSYSLFTKIIRDSKGDMRSMMNLVQSYATGFAPETETPADALTAAEAIPAFFGAGTAKEALGVLWRMSSDPREKMGAFYSSIVTSCTKMPPGAAAEMLAIMAEADILYGRILRTQNWKLLRYLDAMLLRLYVAAASGSGGRGPKAAQAATSIEYSQYNLPWPLLTRIRFDGARIRALASEMGSALHVSSSAFGSLYMPYMLHCIRTGSIAMPDSGETGDDPDGHHTAIISKEAERLAKI